MRPAKETLEGHEEFKERIKRILKGKGKDLSFRTTEEGLRQQLEDLEVHQLRHHADSELQKAKMVNAIYNDERTTGAKQGRRTAQNFVAIFSDFLCAYSGIIQLVRNAGQQYGEVAYETLSVLLIVCKVTLFPLEEPFLPSLITTGRRQQERK